MQSRSRATANLIWILLIFAFSSCVVAAILQAAGIYSRVSAALDEEFGVHTGLNYISSRIRSGDFGGGVTVGEFNGLSAIFCEDEADNGEYITAIYCYDGALRELYCEAGGDFDAEAGEILIPMDEADFSLSSDGLIVARCGLNGKSGSISLSPRSSGGAG